MNLYEFHDEPEKRRGYHQALEVVPEVFWKKYQNNPEELKKREDVLAKSPEHAYEYARSVLRRPFPEGEDAIATHPHFAFWYARNVLDCPFPKGEDAIATNAQYACWYATEILKGPFPKGEDAIAKDSYYGMSYRVFLDGPSARCQSTESIV